MKRNWFEGAALVMSAAIMFSGCQGGNGSQSDYGLSSEEPTEIVIWHYYNGIQEKKFDEYVGRFNGTLGNELGIVATAYSLGTVEELAAELRNSLDEKVNAQPCPDLVSGYGDTIYPFIQAGEIADLTPYFTDEELDEYIESYLNEGRIGGEALRLFPVGKSTELFMLNKTDWDRFAEETGAEDTAFSTWEGIAQVAEEYYQWSGGKAFFGRDAFANYMFVGASQLGTDIYTVDDQGNARFQLDEAVMRRLWDNYYIPYIKGYYTAQGKFRSDDAKTGELIACVASSGSTYYFPRQVSREDGTVYPIEVAVYPAPGFEGCEPTAVQQGAGMAVVKSDQKTEYACCVFMKWFTDVRQNVSFALDSGYFPVKKEGSDLTALEGREETDAVTRMGLETGLKMMDSYQYCTTPVYEKAQEARTEIGMALQNRAAQDREAITELIAAGVSYQEAVAAYNTDENFQQWYEELCQTAEELE